jgi:hypothetical protein
MLRFGVTSPQAAMPLLCCLAGTRYSLRDAERRSRWNPSGDHRTRIPFCWHNVLALVAYAQHFRACHQACHSYLKNGLPSVV